jgi:cytoskeleton protein RodZ
MSNPNVPPPDAANDKDADVLATAAQARAIAEVSEALNGLRELAERVQGPANQSVKPTREKSEAEAQLSLELMGQSAVAAQVISPALAQATQPPKAIPAPATLTPAQRPKVGHTLREAREVAGFTLEDVAAEVKIKLTYLKAIEEGRYGDLPARTYAVGFVRTYAQALGLQSEELVARCRAEVGNLPRTPQPLVMKAPAADKRLPGGALMTACAVLAVVVYAASYSYLRPAATSAAFPSEPPAAETTAAAPATPTVAAPAAPVVTPQVATVAAPVAVAPQPVAAAPVNPIVAPPVSTVITPPAPAPQPVAAAQPEPTDDEFADMAMNMDAQPAAQPAPIPPAAPKKKAEPKTAENVEKKMDEAAMRDLNPTAVVPSKPAKVAPPSRIKLRAVSDAEVRIVDAEGRVLAERMIHRGEAFYVPDQKRYTLATNDAGALRVQVDGHEIPPLGAPGEPMHNIPLTPGELVAE